MTRPLGPRTTPLASDRYRVIASLARGGIANLFLAEDLVTNERVALKVLDPIHANHGEIIDRLLAEHAIGQRARHPNLVEIRTAERNLGGLPFIAMELLDGENLGDLAERGLLELDALLAIAAQVTQGLAALHAAGVTHCDIKPENVFVLYDTGRHGWPRVKLVDYGVARTVETPHPEDETIAGTPPYMAPEQWRGRPCDRSDVYALGCMLFELSTGHLPFTGTLPQLMMMHTEALPPRPSSFHANLPAALDRLIMRCLAKHPTMRPTIGDVHAELVELQHQLQPELIAAAG